jgi:hypothetical protein
MDEKSMISEQEVQAMIHRHRLGEVIVTAIKQLALRSTALEVLVSRVASLWQDADPDGVIFRLSEMELTLEQGEALAAAVAHLAAEADALPSRQRARIDGFLRRLVFLLPTEHAARFVEGALKHKRQSRRRAAYKWLRRNPRVLDLVPALLRVHVDTGDQEPIVLIAREQAAVGQADVAVLLSGLTERYWRARVIESMLTLDRGKAISLAREFPVEFVHAVGRRRDHSLQSEIDSLYDEQKENPEFLCLYVWALGKLRSDTRLAGVLKELEQLYRDDRGSANEGIQQAGGERGEAGGPHQRASPPAADA